MRYRGGDTPYGFTRSKVGKLSPDPREQAAIMLAQAYHATGMTYRAIGNRLLADGYLPRSGGHWHATQVMRMVTP